MYGVRGTAHGSNGVENKCGVVLVFPNTEARAQPCWEIRIQIDFCP